MLSIRTDAPLHRHRTKCPVMRCESLLQLLRWVFFPGTPFAVGMFELRVQGLFVHASADIAACMAWRRMKGTIYSALDAEIGDWILPAKPDRGTVGGGITEKRAAAPASTGPVAQMP